jgi:hypothetical protein
MSSPRRRLLSGRLVRSRERITGYQ